MPKQSIKGAVRDAVRADAKVRSKLVASPGEGNQLAAVSVGDSFVNFAQNMGVGADNPLSTAHYGYNPITRNRVMLEWIHRGSWLGGVAVDTVADDMTRAGVEQMTDLTPEQNEIIEHSATSLKLWERINETIKWARLYGGAIAVALVDGQDPRTPLNLATVAPGQFKGLLVLDRWMVDPTLEDLVTEFGPDIGLPRYYRVQPNAPAMRGCAIHHSRVMIRMEGVQLPYQQRLTENLWGISVLERLYDRMIAFDSASTGAAQLVYKSYLRTLKINGLRDIVAAGGAPMKGIYAYTDMMRRFQGIEGITMLDKDDEFDVQQHSAFSGLSDVMDNLGQQLSGALQIPLVRLFGQSPAGLSATGESDLRMYYDHINKEQQRNLFSGVTQCYQMLAAGKGIQLKPTFAVAFKSLWQLQAKEKSEIATSTGTAISGAVDSGLVGRKTALKELRQSSRVTGVFTNITDEMIEAADDDVGPPGIEGMDGPGLPGIANLLNPQGALNANGSQGPAGGTPDVPRRRVQLQEQTPPGRPAGGQPRQGLAGRSGQPKPGGDRNPPGVR